MDYRAQVLKKSLATRIGNMLASDDPAVLLRGAEIVAKSKRPTDGLHRAGDVINPVLNRGAAARVASERPAQAVDDYFRGGDKSYKPLRSKNHVLQAPAPAKANVHHASMLNNPNP